MKTFLIGILVIFFSTAIFANKIQYKDAEILALKWFNEEYKLEKDSSNLIIKLSKDCYDLGNIYVFNKDYGGYIVLASDDLSIPVLAYSYNGHIDPQNDYIKEYLAKYSIIIDYQKSKKLKHPDSDKLWKSLKTGYIDTKKRTYNSVYPLLSYTSSWAYWNPYFSAVPYNTTGTDGMGCVPLAMSQILKYWEYPNTGTGQNQYISIYGNGMSYSVNFAAQTYNYSLMPYALTYVNNPTFGFNLLPGVTTSNVNEVSKLIYHCGVAVATQWVGFGTLGSPQTWADAMVSYFKYSSSFQYITSNQSDGTIQHEIFKSQIRSSLDNSRPVLFEWSDSAAHAVVINGYQNTNYFYISCGWGGDQDGYFYLYSADAASGFRLPPRNTHYEAAVNLQPNISGLPDFTIQNMNTDKDTYYLSSSMIVNGYVKNLQPYSTNAYNIKIYLSQKSTLDATAICINNTTSGLKMNGREKIFFSAYCNIPSSFSTGYWYVLCQVDCNNTTIEANENNNISCKLITIKQYSPYLLKSASNISLTEKNVKTLSDSFLNSIDMFTLYPNPTKDNFFISTSTTETFNIKIIDVYGKELINKNITSNEQISLKNYPKGTYFVEILSKNQKICQKILYQ